MKKKTGEMVCLMPDMRPNESDGARGLSEAADPQRALSTEVCDM